VTEAGGAWGSAAGAIELALVLVVLVLVAGVVVAIACYGLPAPASIVNLPAAIAGGAVGS
jgi:hypothetical protein